MSNKMFEINTFYTKETFMDFQKFVFGRELRKSWYVYYLIYPCFLMAFYKILTGDMEGDISDEFIIIALPVSIIICQLIYFILEKRNGKALIKEKEVEEHGYNVNLNFYEELLEISERFVEGTLRYEEISKIYERKKYFYIEYSNKVIRIIPKDGFIFGEVCEFKTFVEGKIYSLNKVEIKNKKEEIQLGKQKKIYISILGLLVLGIMVLKIFNVEKGIDNIIGRKPTIHCEEYIHTLYNLPENNKEYSKVLDNGEYTVGVDIPEGKYSMYLVSGDISFDLKSDKHRIWIMDYMSSTGDLGGSELHNVQLYNESKIKIEDRYDNENVKVKFVRSK